MLMSISNNCNNTK